MKSFRFQPTGVCSSLMEIDVDEDAQTIVSLRIVGGCHGNLQGIAALVRGQKITEVADRLRGIRCGGKPTSCPDQLSQALDIISKQS